MIRSLHWTRALSVFGCEVTNFISVLFPEPGFPLIQNSSSPDLSQSSKAPRGWPGSYISGASESSASDESEFSGSENSGSSNSNALGPKSHSKVSGQVSEILLYLAFISGYFKLSSKRCRCFATCSRRSCVWRVWVISRGTFIVLAAILSSILLWWLTNSVVRWAVTSWRVLVPSVVT